MNNSKQEEKRKRIKKIINSIIEDYEIEQTRIVQMIEGPFDVIYYNELPKE